MRQRHIVLAFLVTLGLITFLDRICIAVAGKRMMTDLGFDAAQWGWVQGVFILSYGLFQVPLGALADRYGQRVVLAAVVLWWSAFTSLTGFASGFAFLVAVRFLFGAGEAGAYPAMSGTIGRWFPSGERARAQGFLWAASRLGGALSPLLVVPVQQRWGWRTAFWLLGSVGVAWVAVWWWWYRNSPREKRGTTAAELAELDVPSTTARPAIPWRRLFAARGLWTILAMYFCYVWAFWFYFTWMPTYLEKGRGFSEDQMRVYAALPFLLGVFSNALGGVASDLLSRKYGRRIGRVALGSVSLALAAVCLAVTALASNRQPALIVTALALGFGIMDIAVPPAWAICLDVGREFAGTVSGAMNTAGSIGGFLCATLFGFLVKRYGDYNAPLLVIAGLLAAGAALFLRIDPDRPLVEEEPLV